jgi:flagellin
MIISSNMSAIRANSYLAATENRLSKSLQKLSSGYKINSSEDDSVGKAISERMKVQIRGLGRASQNGSDGISVIETAEGSLNEVTSILQRMRELAVQGSNGTNGEEEREKIQSEISALQEEIDRLSKDTEFNNKSLLDGEIDRKSYALDDTGSLIHGINMLYASDEIPQGIYQLNFTSATETVDFQYDGGGNKVGFTNNAVISKDGDIYTITDENNYTLKFSLDPSKVTTDVDPLNIEVMDMGGMTIQLGANEGQTLNLYIPNVSTEVLGISNLDYTTEEGCDNAITAIDNALTLTLKIRGQLGADQNRLEHAISSVDNAEENLTAALSRIIDVDMASEMSTYTQETVLQQAGISMLSQANQAPEKVLQLLQ